MAKKLEGKMAGRKKTDLKRKIYLHFFGEMSGEVYENRRHKWVEKTLKALDPGLRILDAGAGERRYKKFCSHLDYVSQDFGGYDGTGDGRGLQTESWEWRGVDVICDIADMPFEDGEFDVVMCTEVLEHVPYPEDAVKELVRVLKSGGKLILTAPFSSMTHFAPYHFCTGFNIYWYQFVLEKYGCRIESKEWNGNYFECLVLNCMRIPELAKRYCAVKISLFQKIQILLFYRFLVGLAKRDKGSAELLRGGEHILALKMDS